MSDLAAERAVLVGALDAIDTAIETLKEARRAYTAENFDESLVRREHGRFATKEGDDTRDFESVYPKDAIAEPYCADPSPASVHPCMGAAAAHKYQTEWGASVVNSFLRTGTARLPKGVTDKSAIEAWTNPAQVEQFVADMDSAMSPSTADTMIYRGFVEKKGEGFEVGDRFVDKGYTSGSNLDTWALEFANGRRDGNILGTPVDKVSGTPKIMEIEVPEGTPSMKGNEYVEEFILGRGGEYEVREVLPDGYRVRRVA